MMINLKLKNIIFIVTVELFYLRVD